MLLCATGSFEFGRAEPMAELTFYRQERHDGGVRTGLELDGNTLLGNYQEGPPELQDDPMGSALEWYVDVRCQGDLLPTEAEAARNWLLDQKATIEAGLIRFAEAISTGIDDSFPLRWQEFPVTPEGVQLEVVCSAVRRVTAQRFGEILNEFATRFPEDLRQLSRPEPSFR